MGHHRRVPPSRQRAPRLDPEVRRRQILDAALAVADEDGFGSLTVHAVATRAGITRPVVYDLFGSFGGLLEALLDDAEARAMQAVTAALPELDDTSRPDVVLEQAIGSFMGALHRDPALWRLLLSPPEGAPAEIRARHRRQRDMVVGRIAELLRWWTARVDALEGLDHRLMARTMVAVFEDAARLSLQRPADHTPERLAAAAGHVARLVPLDR
jgi:AcrR family transcriptional regulator